MGVGDELREHQQRRTRAQSDDERLRRMLALNAWAVAAFADTRGITPAEARRLLALNRQRGRAHSACHLALLAGASAAPPADDDAG